MKRALLEFARQGFSVSKAKEFGVYPGSVSRLDNAVVFMADCDSRDVLVVFGDDMGFAGKSEDGFLLCELSHSNAVRLREVFAYTAPRALLHSACTMGLGDRLGIATDGHIAAIEGDSVLPVFAQQSMRELKLTGRTYDDVLDSATFAVFRRGYKKGFGADGDHLKTLEEIEYALRCGYSMITLDCSEYIDNTVQEMSAGEVKEAFCPQPERDCLYLNREFVLGGERLFFDEDTFCRGVLIYDAALKFIDKVYRRAIVNAGRPIDFEISIDETATVTHPLHHYFIARELQRLGIKVATVAPRFCGEFQKGIDYIGDTAQFERELRIHADIAEQFGYKLSIHSGSDKFRIFEIVGRVTKGRFHIKTAGTSWLEAMKAVAIKAPSLYREIHAYALESAFDEARKFYHVTTDLSRIPPLDSLSDEQLPELFSNSDARQLIHITYGHILGAKSPDGSYRFRERLYSLWRREREFCNTLLKNHIGAHLKRLTKTL